ncbi:MAG TPA: TetR family transcriptional regulator [Candidatus Ozemobacteraceae bacterium]|nr:TetR family transcriptional regulator [Candidatus Ozemobacteraceae bacterium]
MPRIHGRNRKQEILDAARELIFTEGATRFTVRRLAERVQITEAALYRHYMGKEALLLALLDDIFHGWQAGIDEIVGRHESACVRLRALVAFHLEHLFSQHFNPVLLLSDAADPEQEELRQSLCRIAHSLRQAIRALVLEGCKRGELAANLDAELVAQAFLGCVQSSVIEWSLIRSKSGLGARLDRLTEFLIGACHAQRNADGKRLSGVGKKSRNVRTKQ